MEVNAEKDSVRRQVLVRRDALSPHRRAQASSHICDTLAREVLETSRGSSVRPHQPTVAIYAAFGSEVNPLAFALTAERAGWLVAYPCMLGQSEATACGQRMCMRAVTWRDRNRAPFLAHPTRVYAARDINAVRFPVIPARELDAIVVPLVAFDKQNNRLGYGGGCYDRFLPTLRDDCTIVGIAFDEQRIDRVPTGPFDLPLPRIISA